MSNANYINFSKASPDLTKALVRILNAHGLNAPSAIVSVIMGAAFGYALGVEMPSGDVRRIVEQGFELYYADGRPDA